MDLDGFQAVALSSSIKKLCKSCQKELNSKNTEMVKSKYYRNICKKCRSKSVMEAAKANPNRKAYVRDYIRRVGIVKEHPCETCQKPCIKKYARAFCSDECRFLSYVDKQDLCWIWNGPKNRRGYGKLSFRGNKAVTAHRVSYELFNGPIEENLFVCHLCDVKECVSPKHLWLGTHKENMIDMTEKGRQSSKITPNQVMEIRKLWEKGYSNAKLRELFNLTSGTISSIIHRRIWKHV
jgi:hypothetical protein